MEQSANPVQIRIIKCPNCDQKYSLNPDQLRTMRQGHQKVRCKTCGLLTSSEEFLEDLIHSVEVPKTEPGTAEPDKTEPAASPQQTPLPARESPPPPQEPEEEKPDFVLSETSFPAMPALGNLKIKEYKVLTLKDKLFAGKFDPERLEYVLNTWASQGWTVISVTGVLVNPATRQDELVIVLERDKA